jgi:hypothetical protein
MTSTSDFYYDTTSSSLRDGALQASTRRSYDRNLDRFLTFTRLPLSSLVRLPPTVIDQRLSEFIDVFFAQRGSYDNACQTVYGLVYRHPPLRLQLGEAHMRLRGWKRLRRDMVRSHPPITWEL